MFSLTINSTFRICPTQIFFLTLKMETVILFYQNYPPSITTPIFFWVLLMCVSGSKNYLILKTVKFLLSPSSFTLYNKQKKKSQLRRSNHSWELKSNPFPQEKNGTKITGGQLSASQNPSKPLFFFAVLFVCITHYYRSKRS